jgi:hypothetical protein
MASGNIFYLFKMIEYCPSNINNLEIISKHKKIYFQKSGKKMKKNVVKLF